MQSKQYWEKRFEQLTAAQLDKGEEYFRNLERQYQQAIAEVEKDLARWYTRYASENGITLTEAKRLLKGRELEEFRMAVQEYIEKGRTLKYSNQWAKQLEAASTKFHVSRLEALKLQMQQKAEAVHVMQAEGLDKLTRDIYADGYYKTAFEVQKGFGIGFDMMRLDHNRIDKLIAKPWAADGKNFSQRIWNNRTQLVGELENRLTQSIIRGQSPKKVIAEIAERFHVSKSRAGALVMTESAFFASASQKDAYTSLGVEQYKVLATLDSHTSEMCRAMDGKVMPMSEHKAGVTAPPFHVRCRSTTVPYFDDEFSIDDQRAARDADGKYYTVPADMTYEEWAAEHVDDATYTKRYPAIDKEQYKRYKNVLRELAPKSIEDFQQIKYNDSDKWNTLKYQYRTVNRYEIEGDVSIRQVLELDNAAWYTKQKGFSVEGLTGKLRKQIKNLSNVGNAGAMIFDGKIYFSHSRIGVKGTLEFNQYAGKYPAVYLQKKRQFAVLDLKDGIPREYDTEAKFLEFVALKKKPDDVFTVTILSEKHICKSCQYVVEQFKKKFPKATVNIVSGKRGYNNNKDGLKTWGNRKKVK